MSLKMTDFTDGRVDFNYDYNTFTLSNSSKIMCSESVDTCQKAPKSDMHSENLDTCQKALRSDCSRFDNVLDIYKKKKMNEIREKAILAIEMLVEEDVDVKILKETVERIKDRNNDKDRYIPDLCYNLYVNNETNDKIKIINEERDSAIKELNEKIQEVKTLLELTDTFQEVQSILKDYGIID